MLRKLIRNITAWLNDTEPFHPVFVSETVNKLFSASHADRINALTSLIESDRIFIDQRSALSNKNAFFAIERLCSICNEQDKPLYPEGIQFCYEVMMADAHDLIYEGELVKERVERTLKPLVPKIEILVGAYGDEFTVDLKLVQHWLQHSISDWDWLTPGVTFDMVKDCQKRRETTY